MKCPKPINRILLMKKKNLVGPFMQKTDQKKCVRTPGNAYKPDGTRRT